MDYTQNYHLPQWDAGDFIKRDDFNDAFAAIDTAVAENSSAITALGTSKATAAALGAETTARENADSAEAQAREDAVSAEATARADADTALQNNIDAEAAARTAALAAVNANLGSHGHNLRIATGSYTGTGTYGSSRPNSLTFDFTPMMVFVASESGHHLGNGWMIRPFVRGYAANCIGEKNDETITVAWSDHGVSWYSAATSDQATYQGNLSQRVYRYLALGYDE